jgi:5-methylcytosine-specific restriction enzyme subunit McrC
MRVDRLACQFDDLTADNIWNRCLKTALYAVKNLSSSFELGRRWLELSAALAEVSLIHLTTKDLEALVFDRQARPYKAAIQWAKWILMVVSPNLRSGANEAPGLVFDMNKLFESSVATMLRRKASGKAGFRIDVQETGAFLTTLKGADGKQAFGLRPDLVIRAAGKVVAVGDTKWSRVKVSPSGYLMPEGAHIYQMQAYASIFPCEHFTLIYPWHSGLEGSKATAFQLPAIGTRRPVINIVCVDVGCDGLRPLTMATGCVIDNLLR